ncbi:hydroxyquinol 1,2-dioxygenase [Labrenzia sp. EL_208]|uniref:dioxygenase family protein n=1 Tax=Roseibium album TaxID=311410 RepID=UPI0018C9C3C7|nr:dioxygenase [Roseibium album]MBG6156974.1 hydroxyquinol 1,2-dioxygenase [Labrenzia sp. EL_162]MBG6163415.1 hydroxyquinol 1,2-dioxygenase [Labrenzia sp. EL_195]MBG6172224.1 hydroxyquinol 1,2-dioxygenase [Labrenzia sp. EL_132]MBG6195085.1 hydroxyquinol 1,2-dioxygenase [Labrenzia sp. EL_159]MBG6227558.1 hydroxyquinol 1,2-dioxygenase [Labrenzia sp. EL_208]MCR9060873.1 hydroxyquinol 1,2-dioxygenase [Paracoccaceae bacterium]
MRHVTKDNITDVFMGYFGPDTDPRLKEILKGLVTHLHDFARETNLTHEEWRKGIEFLEWAGNISDKERHEFVLLSDVLGLSSLVDMLHSSPQGTSSSVLGPFHITGSPPLAFGGDLRKDFKEQVLLATGTIRDENGTPVEGAELDIWQTAPNGLYSSQDPEQDTYSFHGIQTTGADGRYGFTTVKPVSYTVPGDGPVGDILRASGRHPWRPSHLHYIVKASGFKSLVTEIFPDDDPYLDEDTVFGVREDLVMTYVEEPAGSFPAEGYELSGKVEGPYLLADFDLVLVREDS